MAVLKGLTGNPTVSVDGVSRQFSNYGAQPVQGDFAARAGSVTILEDGTAELLEIVTPPERGSLVARADGRLTLDLNDETDTGPLTFTYARTVGGQTTQTGATVTLSSPNSLLGWNRGRFYLPEVDHSTGDLVVEPGPNHRRIHISQNGLSYTDIKALEPSIPSGDGNNPTANWCTRNPASGEGGLYYGETPELAVDQAVGDRMLFLLASYPDTYPDVKGIWCLYERGAASNYDSAPESIGGMGQSMLHPTYIGTYGTGARPYFDGKPAFFRFATRVVATGLGYSGAVTFTNNSHICIDDYYSDYQDPTANTSAMIVNSGGDHQEFGATLRRYRSFDAAKASPSATNWADHPDRMSGCYIANTVEILFEKSFIDHAAWGDGYRGDKNGAFPKPPEAYSHGIYIQSNTMGVTVRDFVSTRNSHNALQMRTGGLLLGMFASGNNAGVVIGRGYYDAATENTGPYTGHWSLMDYCANIRAGGHDYYGSAGTSTTGTTALGHSYGGKDINYLRSIVANSEFAYDVFAGPTEIGPRVNSHLRNHNPREKSTPGGSLGVDELIISNWNRASNPDQNVGAVAEATRDALTVEAMADALMTSSGEDLDSFCAWLRTQDAPWDLLKDINDFFLAPFGQGSSGRTVAQTVTFRPRADGGTPGIRADVELDWDTGDLPGTVSGDHIDLAGHRVYWNMTPKNSVANLTFGAGGLLHMYGGALKPTGTITIHDGGNSVVLEQGSKFNIDGHAAQTGSLVVEANESRFLNTGTVTGGISLIGRYESEIIFGYDTASFTLSAGETVTIYGHCRAGFDGSAGGSAALTLAAGSTTRFLPTLKTDVANRSYAAPRQVGFSGPAAINLKPLILPRIGSTATGQASGATGRICWSGRGGFVVLDDLSGVLQDGEYLNGPSESNFTFDEGATDFATVDGAPEYVLGSIGKVQTGLNGFTAPSVSTTVTLGGTLHLDVTGLANGTYTLIAADTLSGAFSDVTAAGNAAKDLTVSTGATQVQVTVADGSGAVSLV